MLAIPMGFIGVLVILPLVHSTLNVMSLMGVLMLIGIADSNSILIVDFAHNLEEPGAFGGGRGDYRLPRAAAAHPDDLAGDHHRHDSDGHEAGHGQRAIRAHGAGHYRRPDLVGPADCLYRAGRLPAGLRQAKARSAAHRRRRPDSAATSGGSLAVYASIFDSQSLFHCGHLPGTAPARRARHDEHAGGSFPADQYSPGSGRHLFLGDASQDIETDITNPLERFFTLASGVDHFESRSLLGVSIIKITFQPGTSADADVTQISNLALADLKRLPPGTLPPVVLKFDASSLPVCLLTVKGEGLTETQLHDLAQFQIRNQIPGAVKGAVIPPPFGGKYRQVMVYVDPYKLFARQLSPMDVVNAVNHVEPDSSGRRRENGAV